MKEKFNTWGGKESKKRFVTMSINMQSVHFIKDVGQIPYVLFKEYGYDSVIAGYNVESKYLEKEVKGLKTETIKKYKRNIFNFIPVLILFWGDYDTYSGVRYLIKEAKNIDILNLYHIHNFHMPFWILMYKLFNRRGVVYLKLDIPMYLYEEYYEQIKGKRKFPHLHIRGRFAGKVLSNVKKCDLISAESSEVAKLMTNLLEREVLYIPNGASGEIMSLKNWSGKKENIIVCVCNLDVKVKHIDDLLNAYSKLDKIYTDNWKLVLVGPYEKDTANLDGALFNPFVRVYSDFCTKNPELVTRVEVLGEVTNRVELEEIYKKAKIFAMFSTENFSLATVEALSNGCYCVLSDGITPVNDFLPNEDFGVVMHVGDCEDGMEKLKYSIDKLNNCEKSFWEHISEDTIKRFNWKSILKILDESITRILDNHD